MRFALPLSIVLALLAAPATAQPGPVGIGFAAAEEGIWWCRGGDAAKALDCAREKCRAEANGQDCVATRWCSPAAWSGLMVIWLPEFHNTLPLCGAPSEAALVEALKALCANDEVVTRCDLVLTIDPGGREKSIDDVSWPGATAAPPN
jgi:hypothetical protein